MDKLSSFAAKFAGNGQSSQESVQGQNQNQTQGQGQEDYLDRGLDALERKYGGDKIDPAKMRSINEKITDGVREKFEKATGYKVPEKFSN